MRILIILATVFSFISTALLLCTGITQAQTVPYSEIVIGVPDAEARAALERNGADELRYEEAKWHSNGRIRIARIDTNVLRNSTAEVTFTPFADVPPIVLQSLGMGGNYGNTWTGTRIYNRIDGYDQNGQLAEAIENEAGLNRQAKDQILKTIAQVNTVKLKLRPHLLDPNTDELVLDQAADHSDEYVIHAQSGELQSILSFEMSYKSYVERTGIAYPCDQQGSSPAFVNSRDQAPDLPNQATDKARENVAAFEAVQQTKGPKQTGAGNGYLFTHGKHARLQVPCKPSGHVLDRIAVIPANAREYSTAHNYRRARPLPADVRSFDSVGGSITDEPSGPFGEFSGRVYTIKPLNHNPQYVMIYEWDNSKNHHLMDPPHDPEAWALSELGQRYERLRMEKEAYLAEVAARIAQRKKQ
jgi:hypothetical protein